MLGRLSFGVVSFGMRWGEENPCAVTSVLNFAAGCSARLLN